jgi:Mrp family chromosome partitioning ATPase
MRLEETPTINPVFESTSPRDVSFADVVGIVRRRLGLAGLLFAVPIVGALAYYFTVQPVYESRAQLVIARKDAPDERLADELLATHIRWIQSPLIIAHALQRQRLTQLPEIAARSKDRQTVAESVAGRLFVSRGGLGQAKAAQVLDVAYRGDSELESQRVLAAVIDSYHEFLDERSIDARDRALKTIDSTRRELSAELERARARARELLKNPPAPASLGEANDDEVHRDRYRSLQKQLTEFDLRAIETESRLKAVEAVLRDLDESPENGRNALTIIDRDDLARLGGPGDQAHAADPRVRLNAYAEMLRNDLAVGERQRAEVNLLAKKAEEEFRSVNSATFDGKGGLEELAREQEVFGRLVQRLQELRLSGFFGGFTNEVIGMPELGSRFSPKLSVCLAVGTLCGLMLGLLGPLAAEYHADRFRGTEELEALTRAPALAHFAPRRAKLLRVRDGSGNAFARHPPDGEWEPLRAFLLFGQALRGQRSIVFTHSEAGQGNPIALPLLAQAIADAGRKVLLIDCSPPVASASVNKAAEPAPGLCDVLAGRIELLEALQVTSVERLSILSPGRSTANLTDLLSSAAFTKLLRLAEELADYVLLDCPAVNAACLVGSRVDGIVLLVEQAGDRREQVAGIVAKLLRSGARVRGAVLVFRGAGTRAQNWRNAPLLPPPQLESSPGTGREEESPATLVPQTLVAPRHGSAIHTEVDTHSSTNGSP